MPIAPTDVVVSGKIFIIYEILQNKENCSDIYKKHLAHFFFIFMLRKISILSTSNTADGTC